MALVFSRLFLGFITTKISERRHRGEANFSFNFSDAEKASSDYIWPLGEDKEMVSPVMCALDSHLPFQLQNIS